MNALNGHAALMVEKRWTSYNDYMITLHNLRVILTG